MNIFLCANAFKGTLTSRQANIAFQKGLSFLKEDRFFSFPLADGGDSSLDVLLESSNAFHVVEDLFTGVTPGRKRKARYLVDERKTAYLALCETSGLAKCRVLSPERRSTAGFGEQIKHALARGIRDFRLFLGGSSSTDLGSGMLSALGVRFQKGGKDFLPRELSLGQVETIDLSDFDRRVLSSSFTIETDVDSPLLGEKGAVSLFSAQKGTKKENRERLEENVKKLAAQEEELLGRKVRDITGAGAAGGLGFACLLFLKAKAESGAKRIIEATHLEEKLTLADLVVLGEGRVDSSSLEGKALGFLSHLLAERRIPFLVVTGGIEEEAKRILCERGAIHFILSPKPSSNVHANQDTIIKAIQREKKELLEALERKTRGGYHHG